jgi:hypothetical protein
MFRPLDWDFGLAILLSFRLPVLRRRVFFIAGNFLIHRLYQ